MYILVRYNREHTLYSLVNSDKGHFQFNAVFFSLHFIINFSVMGMLTISHYFIFIIRHYLLFSLNSKFRH